MEKSCLSSLVCFTPACTGIVADIERFVRRFVSCWQPTYRTFKELFKEMQMSTIFLGRRNTHHLRTSSGLPSSLAGKFRRFEYVLVNMPAQFVRELLIIVTTYCFPPHDEKTRICGIYLLYAMYFLQPEKCATSVRISLEQLANLRQFMEQLRSRKENDAYVCLLLLFRARAFMFCQFMVEYNPFVGYRPLASFLTNEQKETFVDNSSSLALLDSVLSSDVLQTIILVQRKLVELLSSPEAANYRNLLPPVIYNDIGKEIETIVSRAKKKLNNRLGYDSVRCRLFSAAADHYRLLRPYYSHPNQETSGSASQGGTVAPEREKGNDDDVDGPSTSKGARSLLERRDALKRFAYSYIPSRPRHRTESKEVDEQSLNKKKQSTRSPASSSKPRKESTSEEGACDSPNNPPHGASRTSRQSLKRKADQVSRTGRKTPNVPVEPAASESTNADPSPGSGLAMDSSVTVQAGEQQAPEAQKEIGGPEHSAASVTGCDRS